MLEVGATYEYEYMHQPISGPRHSVVYRVRDKFPEGAYVINFAGYDNDHIIYDGSPMVELSEKVI